MYTFIVNRGNKMHPCLILLLLKTSFRIIHYLVRFLFLFHTSSYLLIKRLPISPCNFLFLEDKLKIIQCKSTHKHAFVCVTLTWRIVTLTWWKLISSARLSYSCQLNITFCLYHHSHLTDNTYVFCLCYKEFQCQAYSLAKYFDSQW